MRFRLRTLLLMLALLPPALAWGRAKYEKHRERQAMKRAVEQYIQRLRSNPSYPLFQ